jgi:hypothetical protein
MLARGSRDQYFGGCPLNGVEGCPRVPCTTGINEQGALLKCWRLTAGSCRLLLLESTTLTKYASARGSRDPQWCACLLNLLEGCSRVSRTTGINEQRANPKECRLSNGPFRLISNILLKSTILTKHVSARVKRPIFRRVPAESRRRVSATISSLCSRAPGAIYHLSGIASGQNQITFNPYIRTWGPLFVHHNATTKQMVERMK